jgi:hypothetical protein
MPLNVGRRLSGFGRSITNSIRNASSSAASSVPSSVSSVGYNTADSLFDALSPVMSLLDRVASPKVIAGAGISAGLLGISSVAGPASMDAAMTTAFGDSNADRYFMGGDISARFMAGSLMGGPIGGALAFSAPDDFFRKAYPVDTGPIYPMATTGILGAAGIGIGAIAGSGIKGRIAGGIAGGAIGSVAGAALGIAPTYSYANTNREFLKTSPYSNSKNTALALNADGGIVLGMHNSRRSY